VPNRVWCADDKGEFPLANRRDCYPLTLTDFASRYLLACEALSTTKERYACAVFERAFAEYGLPQAIRTDTGVPFASAHALYGRSKLAVWWLRLGIALERIAPGPPEQNGRHERLPPPSRRKRPGPPSPTSCSRRPASPPSFTRTTPTGHIRPWTWPPRPAATSPRRGRIAASRSSSPPHAWTAVITTCGRICYQRRKINVSQVCAGQIVGVKPTDDHIWLVTFMDDDVRYFDDETGRLEPIEHPFGPKLLPMSPE
jgi:putative transposase